MSDNNPPEQEKSRLTVDSRRGAVCSTFHVDRKITMHLFAKHELRTLATHNSQMVLWSSIGSAALALVAACIWDMVTSVVNYHTAGAFCGACLIIAVIAFAIAYWNYRDREKQIQEVMEESQYQVAEWVRKP